MKKCVYCGSEADTKEHIPPKGIYPKGHRDNLITVPACKKCNNDFSKDDEYFKVKLFLRKKVGEDNRTQSHIDSMLNGLKRNENFRFLNLLVDEIRGEDIFSYNRKRIVSIAEKTVRGLYYYHFEKILDDSIEIKATIEDEFSFLPTKLKDVLDKVYTELIQQEEKDVSNGIFKYQYKNNISNIEFISAWLLTFYDDLRFIILTSPKKEKRINS